MIYLPLTLFIWVASAGGVEVETQAESIVIEDDMAQAGNGRAVYGEYLVEFETLYADLNSQTIEVEGAIVSTDGWGWRLWSEHLTFTDGGLSGEGVVLSKCVAEWRPWALRVDSATLVNSRVDFERARLSVMELFEVPVPRGSISLTPSSWSVGVPAIDWVDGSIRFSAPVWFRIDEARSAKLAIGWWKGVRLSGELVDLDNGSLEAVVAQRDSSISGYSSADYRAGDRALGFIGDGSVVFGGADLTWFDEYELRSREFLEHRVILMSHGLSFERFGWLMDQEQSAVHSLAFSGGNPLGNLGFERHRVRLFDDGVVTGADGMFGLNATERIGVLEVDGEIMGFGQVAELGGEADPSMELEGDVTLSLPFWARFGSLVHEASVGVRVSADSSIAPSLASRFYGNGSQSVEVWAPITAEGFDLAGAFSHRQGSWFVDLSGEYSDESRNVGGALGFNNDSFELSLNGWLDETMVTVLGTTSLFVPSPHGRWRPSLSSIVSDEGMLFFGAGLGWIADCGCLDVEVNLSTAEDRTTPIVGGVVRLESIY